MLKEDQRRSKKIKEVQRRSKKFKEDQRRSFMRELARSNLSKHFVKEIELCFLFKGNENPLFGELTLLGKKVQTKSRTEN